MCIVFTMCTSKEFGQYLMSMTYRNDSAIKKRGYDPYKLRANFYKCGLEERKEKKTKSYRYKLDVKGVDTRVLSFVDDNLETLFPNEEPPITYKEGETKMYIDDYKYLLVVNYNAEHPVSLSCEKIKLEHNDCIMYEGDDNLKWCVKEEMTTDLFEIFKRNPRIVVDLCETAGGEELVKIYRNQNNV